jgi:succinyl-CoA synthetase alpha subunit
VITRETPVIVQGISGRAGRMHTRLMRAYGTSIVAGVAPRLDPVEGVPVFADCRAAVEATGATASVVFVAAAQLLGAMREAVEAGLRLIVTPTEGMPVHDALAALELVRATGVTWIGPSTPGMAVPGQAKLGFLPEASLAPGPIGVMSKSGTLSYEVGARIVRAGLGQSLWVGVGGDPVKGTRYADLLPIFAADPGTRAVVLIGEVGGSEEEEFAEALRESDFQKPVLAVIAGRTAREGVLMGHAGAIIHGNGVGGWESKARTLRDAGVVVAESLEALDTAIAEAAGRAFAMPTS